MVTSVTPRRRSPGLLWLVLLLVVGSFALVVVALATSRTSWAWGSVAASGVAGGLLVADWVAARRTPAVADTHADQGEPVGRADDLAEADDDGVVDDAEPLSASPTGATAAVAPAEERGREPSDLAPLDADRDAGADGGSRDADAPAPGDADPLADVDVGARDAPDAVDPAADARVGADGHLVPESHVEPAEEATDAADAIATADLDAIVRVIDERPRYHVPSCRWVGDRETLAIELAEARELGFTPCAVCRPDTTLAASARAARAGSA